MNYFSKRIMCVVVSACLVFLSGCDFATSSSEGSLVGYWSSVYGDGFELTINPSDGDLFTQYNSSDKDISFAGIVMNDPDYYADSGYLIIRVTNSGSWGKTEDSYTAIHWKNLSESLVAASSAFKVGSKHNNGMDSFDAAISEYTVENGYFAYHGEYEKQ